MAGWVRGEAGTTVTVVVRNGVDAEPRTYTITTVTTITRRHVPDHDAVTWDASWSPGTRRRCSASNSFSNGSADEVVAALKTIQKAGADRLVLDLRGNPGGYVNEAVGIASQFLCTGDVYVERDADGNETRHPSRPNGVAYDLPLVVLVDAGTASSAEILSGALQDDGRAQIDRCQDLRHRHGPRRVPPVRRLGAADRHRRMADAQGPRDLARGDRPRRRRRARRPMSRW